VKAKYLLDTDIVIDLIKDRYKLKDKIRKVRFSNCYISEITLAELHFGAFYSTSYQKHKKEPNEIANTFNVLPISEVLETFGSEKARLMKEGKVIADFDLLIAVSASIYDCTLITGNEKHHQRIKRVRIENWRKPEFNEFI